MPNTYYATKISPHRGKTDEGYLICSKVPVARIGYQFYGSQELGFTPSEKSRKKITDIMYIDLKKKFFLKKRFQVSRESL